LMLHPPRSIQSTVSTAAVWTKFEVFNGYDSQKGTFERRMNMSMESEIRMSRRAFTIVELIVVMLVLSIVYTLAVPVLSSAGNMKSRSACDMIAADMEYARNMAITHQRRHSVVFDASANSYSVTDSDGTVIAHPVKAGTSFLVNLNTEGRLGGVYIAGVDFDSTATVSFDYLGSPYNGSGNPLNSGRVTVSGSGESRTVTVEPVTGYLTIE